MSNQPIRVLFLCTHNQARSQMAEGLLRKIGGDRFVVFSAGDKPASEIHPLAVRLMQERGIDSSGQYPKNMNIYADQSFDYVITTCQEDLCPVFANDPERIHWGFEDPAVMEGSDEEKLRAFRRVFVGMENRIRAFANLRHDLEARRAERERISNLQTTNEQFAKATGEQQLLRVLVLCTGNSARSQMAEGLFRALGKGKVDVQSAGTQPAAQVNPFAIQAMAERGIDISSQYPKMVDAMLSQRFDYVITVCNQANESCPIFPGKVERIHWDFADPAAVQGSDDEKLAAFRATRNGLEQRIRAFLGI